MSKSMSVSNDLEIYSDYASEWWDERSPWFRSLHTVNQYRLKVFLSMVDEASLKGMEIADLGCGGGLMAVPLAERGARVTGVDISEPSVLAAQARAPRTATFFTGDARDTGLSSDFFDVVLLADVLDHLPDWQRAVGEALRLVRPGGRVFLSTINRTWQSRLIAIELCERIGLVPRGTHEHAMFISPAEIKEAASVFNGEVVATQGSRPMILRTLKEWAVHLRPHADVSIAYAMMLRKVS